MNFTFNRLWFEEVVCNILHARCGKRFFDRMRQIFQDDASRYIWKLLLKLGALMADSATDVDVHRLARIPVLSFLFNGIHGAPRDFRRTAISHIVVEVLE